MKKFLIGVLIVGLLMILVGIFYPVHTNKTSSFLPPANYGLSYYNENNQFSSSYVFVNISNVDAQQALSDRFPEVSGMNGKWLLYDVESSSGNQWLYEDENGMQLFSRDNQGNYSKVVLLEYPLVKGKTWTNSGNEKDTIIATDVTITSMGTTYQNVVEVDRSGAKYFYAPNRYIVKAEGNVHQLSLEADKHYVDLPSLAPWGAGIILLFAIFAFFASRGKAPTSYFGSGSYGGDQSGSSGGSEVSEEYYSHRTQTTSTLLQNHRITEHEARDLDNMTWSDAYNYLHEAGVQDYEMSSDYLSFASHSGDED